MHEGDGRELIQKDTCMIILIIAKTGQTYSMPLAGGVVTNVEQVSVPFVTSRRVDLCVLANMNYEKRSKKKKKRVDFPHFWGVN